MKLFKRKKKIYDFGDFVSDDKNDFGIAKYYQKQMEYYQDLCWKQHLKIIKLNKELQLHSGKRIITELEVRDI